MKRLMLSISLGFVMALLSMSSHAQTGTSLSTAIYIGSYSSIGGPTFSNVGNNLSYNGITYTNSIGQTSPEVYYRFIVTSPAMLDFSLCSSTFDTYIHILNSVGGVITYQDDSPDCGAKSHLTYTLNPGTYYLAVEGYGSSTGDFNLVVNSLNSGGTNSAPSISYPATNILAVGSLASIVPGNTGGAVGGSSAVTSTFVTGMYNPLNTACDASGNVYVADAGNHQVKKISSLGVVTVLAGAGYAGYADGTGTSAVFQHPSALTVDASGNVYVSDQQNHRIRKITPAGVVTTLAGSGSASFADGTGTAASFSSPIGLALDGSGNLYVADYSNNRIRKVTPSGVVTTYAGTGTAGITNGAALSSTFRNPMGLAFDATGNLYVADRINHVVRKITSGGIVSTLAGNGTAGFAEGTGTAAMFNEANALTVDAGGNIFLVDRMNNRIRKITPAGVVTTLAGNGTAATVNGSGSVVSFNSPYGVSIDAAKANLYVAENSANVIRKISLSGGGYTISPALPAGLSLNASTGIISGTPTTVTAATTYTVTATNGEGSSTASFSIRVVANLDPYINAIQTKSYDDDGVQISESKSYYSDNGKSIQSQVKNITANQVLASEVLYDALGRSAGATLAAPTNSAQLNYKPNFIINANGSKYDHRNFDGGKTNAPDPVSNTSIGTLGWYYSNNNTLEPYVAATSYPYSRNTFYNDGTGAVKKTAGVGEAFKMGSGYQASSNTTGVQNELDFYNQLRVKFFPETQVGARNSLVSNGMLEIAQDVNGVQVASVTDLEGRVLMTAKPDVNGGLTVTNSVNISNQGGYEYEINWNENGVVPAYAPYIRVNGGYIEVLKSTNNWVSSTTVYSGTAVGFNSAGNTQGKYKVISSAPFNVSFRVPANNIETSVCKACNAKPASDTKDQIHYFRLLNPALVTIGGTGWKLYNMSVDEQEVANQGSPVQLPAGYYKVSIPETGNATISYANRYSDISYNFYNQLGQLVGSIAPEGVKAILNNGIIAYPTFANVPFRTTYEYDLQGRLIANTQTDAGKTEFIYRQDGNIRFSQNSVQQSASPKRFSYTNYDRWGRSVESGEFVETATITFALAKTNTALQESIAADGGLTGGTKQGWVKTYYDVANGTHGVSGYVQDVAALRGAVSWTENAGGSKTWYNYNGEGRLVWMIRTVPGLGNKTIDYSYDAKGNASVVDFQKNTAAERFTHEYNYDADNRLTTVYTTAATSGRKLQAKYSYYVHGPLKRAELGTNLQGIDYVYTAQGLLKSINHSTEANDPGKDGVVNSFSTDVFGQTLEYFNGDYTRGSTNITSIAIGGTSDYSGSIMGQSWRSQKPNAVVTAYGAAVNNPAMVTYAYNDKYQFSNNKFGAPNFGSNSFSEIVNANREHDLGYDANGNITTLKRTNAAGTNTANYMYSYLANTNKLSSVGSYATYTYDALGQMASQVRTAGSQGYYLNYDVNGKVTAIYSNAAKTTLRVSFAYDESGNRVRKTDHVLNQITYYVYDAAGNLLSVYDNKGTAMGQKELPVYAASRVGTYTKLSNNYQYELTDHLGNVRAVINEVKQGNGKADVVYYSDYYPYGSPLTLANSDYRYGYQGQYAEVDKETGWNNFDLRMYDPGIGRWMSTDPAGQFYSPYVGMGNNPVSSVDPDGGYSWLGAAWRHVVSFAKGEHPEEIYNNGNTWGFNTGKGEGIVGHFADAKPSKIAGQINGAYNQLLRKSANWKVGEYNSYTKQTNGWGGIKPNYFFEEVAIGGIVGRGVGLAYEGLTSRTIYRVVSNNEAIDILAHGFRQAPISSRISAYEGKLFWTNIDDAHWFNNWAGEGNQILKIKVNKSFIFENGTDVGRPFYFVSPEKLPNFNSAIRSIK
ncbi:RHS repeat-associated core domain-containing protein [Pedobacter panaciterrae]|uniref:RHS repeat-associated core domain-containing protein n=1 Tax=Pedobacter panaciterrae TaxID=363849 RepID=UPI0025918F79|nr:RHS repeat-associated core domain-containing protein [uncultured Pedobacter sp.]